MMMSRSGALLLLCLLAGWTTTVVAFAPVVSQTRRGCLYSTEAGDDDTSDMPDVKEEDISSKVKEAAASYDDAPKMNPDRPELPELKGDFDWDAKFSGEEDWITDDVPGKVVLSDLELAAQVTALGKLEEKWKRERIEREYEAGALVGFTARAEMFNGRFAMFFLVVGLLTEYWTGVSMPGQVEEMLRVVGFLGFEG